MRELLGICNRSRPESEKASEIIDAVSATTLFGERAVVVLGECGILSPNIAKSELGQENSKRVRSTALGPS